jgi:hypothetical protein
MRGFLVRALFCAVGLGCAGILSLNQSAAIGGTLNLSPSPPDLGALSLTTSYAPSSGSTGTLSVTGWPTAFTYSGTHSADIDVTDTSNMCYDLQVLLNKNTGQLISGSLTIGGSIAALGAKSGTLLTGTVTSFGYMPGGGNVFEFLLTPTGGDLKNYYSGKIGIELTAGFASDPKVPHSSFTGSFLTPFVSPEMASLSDNFNFVSVPEPSSICLLTASLSCGLLAVGRRRRRREVSRG